MSAYYHREYQSSGGWIVCGGAYGNYKKNENILRTPLLFTGNLG